MLVDVSALVAARDAARAQSSAKRIAELPGPTKLPLIGSSHLLEPKRLHLQLEEWARRADCEIVTGPPESDPGSVAFEAVRRGREQGADVVIVDTAGRLHTQDDLMAELTKVRRVIGKQLDGAPHETLLTVDATTGQNGLRQARLFSEATPVTGIVLTKLDGTAKGGIALAIAGELGIPVKLIGIGEQLEDLRPFDPQEYARALLDA